MRVCQFRHFGLKSTHDAAPGSYFSRTALPSTGTAQTILTKKCAKFAPATDRRRDHPSAKSPRDVTSASLHRHIDLFHPGRAINVPGFQRYTMSAAPGSDHRINRGGVYLVL